MHYEEIKYKLRNAGYTLASIADMHGVTRGAVSQVIRGDAVSKKIAQTIAEITKFSFVELWPGKYPLQEFSDSLRSANPDRYRELVDSTQTLIKR
jgi:lambda repressor-like predicted transcriptional regulator